MTLLPNAPILPANGVYDVPLVHATAENFAPYGRFVFDFAAEPVEIVTWPQPGWRPVQPGTGNEGGVTAGEFHFQWREGALYAQNHAVNGDYIVAFADPTAAVAAKAFSTLAHAFVREANYHPDGGQVFFPTDACPYLALLALPGDDVQPHDFTAFYCDGSFGIQIWPNIWHQPILPLREQAVFWDKQGKVHACIAVDFVQEFELYLRVPLRIP